MVGNIQRGMSRLISLLSLFNLNDKLTKTIMQDECIDWNIVNEKWKQNQTFSMNYLYHKLI